MIKVGDTLPAATLMEFSEVEGNGCSIGGFFDDSIGVGKVIFWKRAPGAKGGRLRTHAKFRPESRQEHAFWKCLDRLAIGFEPEVVIDEVIRDIRAAPTRQPGAVDDEANGKRRDAFAFENLKQLIPL